MVIKGSTQLKIPPLYVVLGFVVLMLAAGAYFYFMIYTAKVSEITAVETQYKQQLTRAVELEDTRRNLLEVQAKADRLKRRLDLLKAKLPESQEDLNEFLSAISQRGQNARLDRWIKFEQEPLEPYGEVDAVPIRMEFNATYDAAAAFFWELSTMGEGVKTGGKEQIVSVVEIEVDQASKAAPGVVKVKCLAKTYLYREQAVENADGAAGKRGRRGGRKR